MSSQIANGVAAEATGKKGIRRRRIADLLKEEVEDNNDTAGRAQV